MPWSCASEEPTGFPSLMATTAFIHRLISSLQPSLHPPRSIVDEFLYLSRRWANFPRIRRNTTGGNACITYYGPTFPPPSRGRELITRGLAWWLYLAVGGQRRSPRRRRTTMSSSTQVPCSLISKNAPYLEWREGKNTWFVKREKKNLICSFSCSSWNLWNPTEESIRWIISGKSHPPREEGRQKVSYERLRELGFLLPRELREVLRNQ